MTETKYGCSRKLGWPLLFFVCLGLYVAPLQSDGLALSATSAIVATLLQKGQVGKYEVILDREGRVLRTMGTAVAVGSVGVHALARAGYTRLQAKPLRLGGVIPGAVLFGTGLAGGRCVWRAHRLLNEVRAELKLSGQQGRPTSFAVHPSVIGAFADRLCRRS